jgi:hypothetical protein
MKLNRWDWVVLSLRCVTSANLLLQWLQWLQWLSDHDHKSGWINCNDNIDYATTTTLTTLTAMTMVTTLTTVSNSISNYVVIMIMTTYLKLKCLDSWQIWLVRTCGVEW